MATNIRNYIKKYSIFFIFISLFSCESDFEEIPNVYVNVAIDMNDPEFFDLRVAGNWIHITGGYAGIIVYRASSSEFKAYERACPNHPYSERVTGVTGSSLAVDSVCGTTFSLILDGIVMRGTAPQNLKMYSSSFNTSSGMLFIFNGR